MTNSAALSPRLQEILSFIQQYINDNGYAPSVRDIGSAKGIPSSSTVHGYLKRLEEAGVLRRNPARPRAMVLQTESVVQTAGDNLCERDFTRLTEDSERPFSGAAAHQSPPLVAFDEVAAFCSRGGSGQSLGQDSGTGLGLAPHAFPYSFVPPEILAGGSYFLTVMPDDSMSNRQLYNGDFLLVRRQDFAGNSDIIIGCLHNETLIRTYSKGLRQVRLQAESEDIEPLLLDSSELMIYGVIVGFLHLFS